MKGVTKRAGGGALALGFVFGEEGEGKRWAKEKGEGEVGKGETNRFGWNFLLLHRLLSPFCSYLRL